MSGPRMKFSTVNEKPPTKLRRLALVFGLALLLAGCGTFKQERVATGSGVCRLLANELAGARGEQARAEAYEAGIAAGCWSR